jgi:hypothetical protein
MLDQRTTRLAPAEGDRDERSMKVFEYAISLVVILAAALLGVAR